MFSNFFGIFRTYISKEKEKHKNLNKWYILLFFIIGYAIIGFIGLMFIQLISYRVFKVNLYKKIIKKFMEV